MHPRIFIFLVMLGAILLIDSSPASAGDIKDEMLPITQAYQQGDFPKALLLAEAMRKKYEARVGKDGEEMCFVHMIIAESRRSLGELAAARASAEQGIRTCGKSIYIAADSVAGVKMVLALIELESGNEAKAEQLTLEVIAAFEKSELAGSRARLPTVYSSLAEIRRRRGNLSGAEEAIAKSKALESQPVTGRSPASTDPEFVKSRDLMMKRDRLGRMTNDALILEKAGDHAAALRKMEEAVTFGRANLAGSPSLASTIMSLVSMRQEVGRYDGMVDLIRDALLIRQKNVSVILAGGSETQRTNALASVNDTVDAMMSVFAFKLKDDPRARTTAFEAAILRKGRSLDAYVDTQALLRKHGSDQDRRELEELRQIRGKLLAATASGDAAAETQLTNRAELLERTLAGKSRSFRAESDNPLNATELQKALPEKSALVEFVVYEPIGEVTGSALETRTGAFVLRADHPLAFVDLGVVDELEPLVAAFRQAVSNPGKQDWLESGRKLRARLWDAIEGHLKGCGLVFLATEGVTSSVPFAALPAGDNSEQQQQLVDQYVFDYLTSGRDLIRFTETPPPLRNRPMIIAAPDFDDSSTLGAAAIAGVGNNNNNNNNKAPGAVVVAAHFTPLEGTEAEAKKLTGVLRPEQTLTHGKATERALRDVRGPSILHIATHGFYLADAPRIGTGGASGARKLVLEGAAATTSSVTPTSLAKVSSDPLLRSGIALAGANAKRPPPEDGIITAHEAANLDLYGTRLVTLSACETGLGDATSHEGVMGLRRALLLAGSQTQLLTLWQVDDTATVTLMEDYYGRVRSGASRAGALRTAQVALKKNPSTSHPFYWAAFAVSGDYRPFNAVGTSGGSVPSVKGCGCRVVESPRGDGGGGGGGGGWMAIAVAAVLGGRRRMRRSSKNA